ncbi:heat shock 70 kDa protein BIP3 [Ziziphus jujuba]|uniref:Heat shock 70 kDa protein BIP3 n=1 Tax=Ziziphus jujuba TaxID=326968 RepID=A0A6P6GHJ3_ZIZJJ|nr:heat shock 70 kDa protein BIP3 [Ziziphus jujuba]
MNCNKTIAVLIVFVLVITLGIALILLVASDDGNKVRTIIGIDLGSTNTISYMSANNNKTYCSEERLNDDYMWKWGFPSWVSFTDSERLVGLDAKNQAPVNANRTIFNINLLIGRKFDDPQLHKDIKFLPYKVVNKYGKPYINVKVKDHYKLFSPEQIIALILRHMKLVAEAHLGHRIKNAVITVPAYFNDAQRQATKVAAKIAGLNVARMINKSTAAAIGYYLKLKGNINVLVYHFGGRTFEVSVLTIKNGVIEVVSENVDTRLGGEDINDRMMDYLIHLIKEKHNKDIIDNNKALEELRNECERTKRLFSIKQKLEYFTRVKIYLDGICFSEVLTLDKFEELNDLLGKNMTTAKKVLEESVMKKSGIHENEVVSKNGDTHLGGVDINGRLMDYFIHLMKEKHNKDISNEDTVLEKLGMECERAKKRMRTFYFRKYKDDIRVKIDGIDFTEELTLAKYEELNQDLIEKTMTRVKKALEDSGMKKSDIHEIVLSGGSTEIGMVRRLLKDFFDGKVPCKGLMPDHVCAFGAAVEGENISRKEENQSQGNFHTDF